jgi:hypothetical protein
MIVPKRIGLRYNAYQQQGPFLVEEVVLGRPGEGDCGEGFFDGGRALYNYGVCHLSVRTGVGDTGTEIHFERSGELDSRRDESRAWWN